MNREKSYYTDCPSLGKGKTEMAGREGVEPSLEAPKAPVLPLDDLPAQPVGPVPPARIPAREPAPGRPSACGGQTAASPNVIGKRRARQAFGSIARTPPVPPPRSSGASRCSAGAPCRGTCRPFSSFSASPRTKPRCPLLFLVSLPPN